MNPSDVYAVDDAVAFLNAELVKVHGDSSCLLCALLANDLVCHRLGIDPAFVRAAISTGEAPLHQLDHQLNDQLIASMRDVSQLPPDVALAVEATYNMRDGAIAYCTDEDNQILFSGEPECWLNSADTADGTFNPAAFAPGVIIRYNSEQGARCNHSTSFMNLHFIYPFCLSGRHA